MRFRSLVGWSLGASFIVSLTLAPVSAASAAWATQASGSGAGAAAVMPTGSAPTGSASGTSVTINWPAATMSSGVAVAGYVISRINTATGSAATVGAGCGGVVTATTCTETSVPAGSWAYMDTPVEMNWSGGRSAESATIVMP
jgi:hypothetical protein